jgi:hypothetical protein
MSDYTKATNFASKDSLSSGNSLKIVKGTEIDTEFNSIATAIATKADLSSPTFTGTPTLPTGTIGVTQSSSDSSTKLATTAFVQAVLQVMYPVGSLYFNATSSTSPATSLGFGTWVAFGAGKTLIGLDSGDATFSTVGNTGGSKDAIVVSHNHTATFTGTALGTHRHYVGSNDSTAGVGGDAGNQEIVRDAGTGNGPSAYTNYESAGTPAGSVSVASTGSSATGANLPPYVVVYMWKRTA